MGIFYQSRWNIENFLRLFFQLCFETPYVTYNLHHIVRDVYRKFRVVYFFASIKKLWNPYLNVDRFVICNHSDLPYP